MLCMDEVSQIIVVDSFSERKLTLFGIDELTMPALGFIKNSAILGFVIFLDR